MNNDGVSVATTAMNAADRDDRSDRGAIFMKSCDLIVAIYKEFRIVAEDPNVD